MMGIANRTVVDGRQNGRWLARAVRIVAEGISSAARSILPPSAPESTWPCSASVIFRSRTLLESKLFSSMFCERASCARTPPMEEGRRHPRITIHCVRKTPRCRIVPLWETDQGFSRGPAPRVSRKGSPAAGHGKSMVGLWRSQLCRRQP